MAKNNAIIIFSRLPIGRETKTRLSTLLNEKEREILHITMWKDIFSEVIKLKNSSDIFLFWTGNGNVNDYKEYIPEIFKIQTQIGLTLGDKMKNSMEDIFKMGYSRAILIGSDIPALKSENLQKALYILKNSDIVLGSSLDGGYWLIGMSKFIPEVFNVSSWGISSVLENTITQIKQYSFKYEFCDTLSDIDTPDDIKNFMLDNRFNHTKTFNYLKCCLKLLKN